MTSYSKTVAEQMSWPHGIISPELDVLELTITGPQSGEFETLYALLCAKEYSVDQSDYLLLLKLERLLLESTAVDIEGSIYQEFFFRRMSVERVAFLYFKLLWKNKRVQEARSHLKSLLKSGFDNSECLYFQSLICLNDQDYIGWLNAVRGALDVNSEHIDALISLVAFDLEGNMQLNSLAYVERYLENDPLNQHIRALYADLLIKYGREQQAEEEKTVIAFLNT